MPLNAIGSFLGVPVGLLVFLWILKAFKAKKKLDGKVILITGANSGLGKACAKAFYQAKCKVILCGRNRTSLEDVKKELTEMKLSSSFQPEIVVMDLENLSAIPQAISEALRIHNSIDILINNAGISYRGEIHNTMLDVDIKLMTVNYFAQVAIIKAVLPTMKLQKSGSIVNISSVQGKIAIPYRSAYTASKHAIQSFSDTLRAEVAEDNIHVCVISPGYIKTNLSHNAVCGDGSMYGVMDKTTESGMEPSYVATCVLSAIESGDNEYNIGEIVGFCLKRRNITLL